MSLADLSPSDAGRGVFLRKQTGNIYTVMLILSFVFVAIGCLFLFLEMKAYDGLSTRVAAEAKVPPPPALSEPGDAAAPGADTPSPTNAIPTSPPADAPAAPATPPAPDQNP